MHRELLKEEGSGPSSPGHFSGLPGSLFLGWWRGCALPGAGGGGAGKVSESPRETVESLDQAGKGRVDWEAEKEPGSGVGSSSPLEHLGPTQLGFPFQST